MSNINLTRLVALLGEMQNLDLNNQKILDALPVSIYWKNKEGIYLGQNKFAEAIVKQEGVTDANAPSILNKTDYDLFNELTANQFRQNDLMIMDKDYQPSGPMVEKTLTPDKRILPQISIKHPLHDSKQQIIGVIGCTIPAYQYADFKHSSLLSNDLSSKSIKQLVLELLASKTAISISELAQYLRYMAACNPGSNNCLRQIHGLSDRELQCLCLLARGCSAKEIGQVFSISSRTIEVYINKIRQKLELSFKSQLSDWMWQLFAIL